MSIYLEKNVLNLEKEKKVPKIGILNLMPNKIETEIHFLNLLSQVSIDIYIYFIRLESYIPKNCSFKYLKDNYITLNDIENDFLDGLIITGAPLELKEFEEVEYWQELSSIMEFSKKNIKSTIYICWGALAGFYYHYGIPKYNLEEKIFGVFPHNVLNKNHRLLKGFDDEFLVPHSRYSLVREEDIRKEKGLEILSTSDETGIFLVSDKGCNKIFLTGHLEYESETLKKEYERDTKLGKPIKMPKYYSYKDDLNTKLKSRWRAHATLFYTNWIYEYLIR